MDKLRRLTAIPVFMTGPSTAEMLQSDNSSVLQSAPNEQVGLCDFEIALATAEIVARRTLHVDMISSGASSPHFIASPFMIRSMYASPNPKDEHIGLSDTINDVFICHDSFKI